MKITGTISNSQNEPLGLANITRTDGEQAGKFGTIANLDGVFSLESDSIAEDSTFTVSYVGYVPQTFTAKQLDEKNIVLQENAEALGEVTVFGSPKIKVSVPSISNFQQHLKKHKMVYAGIGLVSGILIILSSIKKS